MSSPPEQRPGPGTVALVGSGEFLQAMIEVDKELLSNRPPRAVFLPTAAGEEGDESVRHWIDLGTAHFEALGVEPVPLPVLTREDAEAPELAALVAGAGLVYLSGGNPGYLADTLRGTRVWRAIVSAWQAGAALAGCSAGACALTRIARDLRRPGLSSGAGLGAVPGLAVIPHYDRITTWVPDIVERTLALAPPDVLVVGIDEETALVGDESRMVVAGRQAAWVLSEGAPVRYAVGSVLEPASRYHPVVTPPVVVVEPVEPVRTFELRQQVLRPHQRPDQLALAGDDDPDTGTYAALDPDTGEVLGTANVRHEAPPADFDEGAGAAPWRLRGMATREDLRNQGIGALVLDACVDHVASHGGGLLWCTARLGARRFYARAGFAEWGDEYDTGFGPHVVMWRVVTPARSEA